VNAIDLLACGVRRLEYDFDARAGRIYFPAHECCDMQACIDLFTAIHPDVRLIRTFSGSTPDTTYRKRDDGTWTATISPPR
jgi:hypothetical protein